jgi:DNA-binding transcriptional MerR regulator
MKRVLFVEGLLTIMVLMALMTVPGCSEKEKPQSKSAAVSQEDVKQEVKEAYNTAKVYTQEQIQSFQEEKESKLAEYKKAIDLMQAKVGKLEGDANATAEQRMSELRHRSDEVAGKLIELSSSSGDAWGQQVSDIEEAMEDLGSAYRKAVAKFSRR